ncbi:exonuclease 1-like [Pollicipes pollicipes]|uniref:exonuclease 1-like n=1 Tax=Pollicipes pollicipes TaxID=41117 RepID=UPI0018859499|nr:exonuclease 1-like [Pollicipes pollicipes]
MGISGLLPFLKRSTRPASVREFSGGTVAVDAYSWLHKGAFACADRLAQGQPTDVYVRYCLKYINLLLSHGVKPILVFDGCHLPSKQSTETKRREERRKHRALAADHLRAGRDREARDCFQRCVDVTPAMALQVIKACRSRGVDCVVAPYEADAQLAFLARNGIADLVITEDSDLVLFGCPRILFKMDAAGNGRLIESSALPLSLGGSADKFSLERLRLVCILSGCDYLASLPGVGLGKASKLLVRAAGAADVTAILDKLPAYLNMRSLTVSAQYKRDVQRAEDTFLYQLVFDPLARRLVPLTRYPAGRSAADYPYAGAWMDDAAALQIALGNVDVATGAVVDTYCPDRPGARPAHAPHRSIWARDYVPARRVWPAGAAPVSRASTAGKVSLLSVWEGLKRTAAAAVRQKPPPEEPRLTQADLAALYAAPAPPAETESQPSSGEPADGAGSSDGDGAGSGGLESSSVEPDLRRRLSGGGGEGLTEVVTSKYFATPAEPAADPLRAPVQSMEEFLKRRRDSQLNLKQMFAFKKTDLPKLKK